MTDSAELAFVKSQLNTLGSLPVNYPSDYQQLPQNSLKKVPSVSIELPSPPVPKSTDAVSASESISITFKSAKPPRTFTLPLSPVDTIASVKEQLASQPGAPPAGLQRLLLRGKALADGKLLKEYAPKSGDVVNLMLKPGAEWDWNAASSSAPTSSKHKDGHVSMHIDTASVTNPVSQLGHSRIPSVVLCPSPSPSPIHLMDADAPIPLTLDTTMIPTTDELDVDAYHRKIQSAEFWDRLYAFLKLEFDTENDATHAFETFLIGSKGALTPSGIAKIRDTVGVTGMAGT